MFDNFKNFIQGKNKFKNDSKMQKNLTRYSQCGNLTLLFGTFVVMFTLSSTALTTFGVNKPQNNPLPATPTRN